MKKINKDCAIIEICENCNTEMKLLLRAEYRGSVYWCPTCGIAIVDTTFIDEKYNFIQYKYIPENLKEL